MKYQSSQLNSRFFSFSSLTLLVLFECAFCQLVFKQLFRWSETEIRLGDDLDTFIFFFFSDEPIFSIYLKRMDKREKSNFGLDIINQIDEWTHYFDWERIESSNHSLNDSSSVFIMSTI